MISCAVLSNECVPAFSHYGFNVRYGVFWTSFLDVSDWMISFDRVRDACTALAVPSESDEDTAVRLLHLLFLAGLTKLFSNRLKTRLSN